MRGKAIPVVLVAVSLVLVLGGALAKAETLEVQLTGLDLVYDGNRIIDAKDAAGGDGDPAQSDPLSKMVFLRNGADVGQLPSGDIYADVRVLGVAGIPEGGGFITTGGNGGSFGFDLLTSSGNPGYGIALDIDKFLVFYSGGKVTIAATGLATGVPAQNLPFGMGFDTSKQIGIIVSSTNLSNVTAANGFLTGFSASGTGSLSGTLDPRIPEPSSLVALLGLGLAGLLACVLRRRARS